MKKNLNIFILGLITIMLCSCNSIQPVLILTPGDFIMFYFFVGIASFILALYMTDTKGFGIGFWIWFIVGMIFILLPIAAAVIKYKSKK